ncbi:MAG: hypothetical protein FWG98_15545 [Candidatus Cloacimonetes bacterium]|nr:hypothetical protein [Candidatus Cloacimonadota bacterium]
MGSFGEETSQRREGVIVAQRLLRVIASCGVQNDKTSQLKVSSEGPRNDGVW